MGVFQDFKIVQMVPNRLTHHVYKIPNTLKLFWFTVDSSVLLKERVQIFFHDICHFFVCIADCQSNRNLKANSKSFEYLLPAVISYFICSPCLRKKYVSLDINLGTWPKSTESLLSNAIVNLSCIDDPGKARNDDKLAGKTNWQAKKKNFLRMKILFHVYIRLIMIILL